MLFCIGIDINRHKIDKSILCRDIQLFGNKIQINVVDAGGSRDFFEPFRLMYNFIYFLRKNISMLP